MNEEIKKWMQGKQAYAEGVALFEAFGNNPVMLRQLNNSRPRNMMPYLKAELKKLLTTKNRYVIASAARQTVRNTGQGTAQPPSQKVVRKESIYEQVVAQRKERFVKMARLRNSMADMKTDEQRAKAVDAVEKLQEENKQLWEAIDYYDKHGTWKDGKSPLTTHEPRATSEQPVPDTEKVLAQAEWEKLRKRITRAEKALVKLAATEGKESAKYIKKEKDLHEMYAEKDALHKKMGK
jgi:hypothetical protein